MIKSDISQTSRYYLLQERAENLEQSIPLIIGKTNIKPEIEKVSKRFVSLEG